MENKKYIIVGVKWDKKIYKIFEYDLEIKKARHLFRDYRKNMTLWDFVIGETKILNHLNKSNLLNI
tara:strand:- start:237 stop:434 length:198 start_codon:yes stop_codon:yes gene_type:complete